MKEKIKKEELENLQYTLRNLQRQKKEVEAKIIEAEQLILNEYAAEIQGNLAAKDEPYGDVTIGDIKFKIPKYVKWDEAKLEKIAATLDNPTDYIDVKLSVSETSYKTLPENLKTVFSEARKVSSGKINISFKEII